MIQNAKTLPKVYFGLHMCPGVAEYREPGAEPYRIMVDEQAIKNMDPTFQGRPVYVKHVDEVDLEKIQEEADGYVVKSFFNKADGKHWAEFIVVSDRAHDAIRSGWKLSNAYIPKEMNGGGLWHGVEYQKEVMRGEYEHLAIVPNPRYEESIILTPEQFKDYNEKKEMELKKLSNSKTKGAISMFNFFKKTKVENEADFENMSVILPKSKKEKTLAQVINELDTIENMQGYANGDHMVKVGEDEMTVNDLISKHMDMKNKMDEAEKAAAEKKENDGKEDEDKKKENEEKGDKEDKDAEEKKQNEADRKKENFKKLKNAGLKLEDEQPYDLTHNQIARGKDRYGSQN